jgi:hypothetical protein
VVLVAPERADEVTAVVPSLQEAKRAGMGFSQWLNDLELHDLSLVITASIAPPRYALGRGGVFPQWKAEKGRPFGCYSAE